MGIAASTRESFTSIRDINHGGPTKRPTETRAFRTIDEWEGNPLPIPEREKLTTLVQSRDTNLRDETQRPAIPSLKNLESLMVPPENLSEPQKKMIQNAAEEVSHLLKTPLKITENTLSGKVQDASVRAEFEEGYNMGRAALEFLNDFCDNLHGKKFLPDGIELNIDNEHSSGYRLGFKSTRPSQFLGRIGNETIKEAEIVVRTGENQYEGEVTPMQLNFRFLNEEGEITSLRVDMHNRNEQKVEVDAQLGNKRMQILHQRVDSLNNEGSSVDNFRVFQYVFLHNFINNVLAEDIADEGIVLKDNIHLANDPHNLNGKRLLKSYQKAKKTLGLVEIIPTEEENQNKIEVEIDAELSKIVSQKLGNVFAKTFSTGNSENGQNQSKSNQERICEWVLGQTETDREAKMKQLLLELRAFEKVQNIRFMEEKFGMETDKTMLQIEYNLIEDGGNEEDLTTLEKLYSVKRLLELSY